jgi:hypothetical protein
MIRENSHVGKIYHGRLGRECIARDRSRSTNADRKSRPPHYTASGDDYDYDDDHYVGILAAG